MILFFFLLICVGLSSPLLNRVGTGVNRMIGGSDEAYQSHETVAVSSGLEKRMTRYMWYNTVAPCVPKRLQHPFKCEAQGCTKVGTQTELVDVFTHSGDVLDVFTDRTISGFLALDHKNKEILLVLRGTQDANDWVTDLRLRLVPLEASHLDAPSIGCHGCQVNVGFLEAYQHTWRVVDSTIRDLKKRYPHYQLVLTGHSLGGTAAILFGLNYKLNGLHPTVFTAGAPAIGNKQFANFADQVFWGSSNPDTLSVPENRLCFLRLTHRGDLIPRFPFWGGYQQMSGEIFINDIRGIYPPLSSLRRCNGQQNNRCSFGDQNRQLEMNFRPHSAYLVPGSECSFSNREGHIGRGGAGDTVNAMDTANTTEDTTDTTEMDPGLLAVEIPVVAGPV